jgi:hypothetical protein
MNGYGLVEFALCVLLLLFAAFLLVATLGAAGCIDSEAFKNRRTIIIVNDPAEAEKVLLRAP